MSPAPWNRTPDVDDDQASLERPRPTLVSLHFIRTALRRRLLVCVLSAVLGLLGGRDVHARVSTAAPAKASLVLTYDPQVEPTRAMATNVSLLRDPNGRDQDDHALWG